MPGLEVAVRDDLAQDWRPINCQLSRFGGHWAVERMVADRDVGLIFFIN